MFGALQTLRSKPIPPCESARTAIKRYRDLPIDQSAREFSEKLTLAGVYGLDGANYYAHARNPPYWKKIDGAIEDLWVRESVGARLAAVDKRLSAEGLKLFLFDAWRPRAVQAYFHDVWMPAEVRRRYPAWSAEQVKAEVERYWAAPSQSALRPAPHATGAAVDLTIVWGDGQPLWMGSLFDDATGLAHPDRFEGAREEISYSNEEACANRRLLFWLMTEAGFASLPSEWWHYSFGDQIWAAQTGAAHALYGAAEP